MSEPVRCPWALATAAEAEYHDKEWGTPRRDDAGQFEFLILETAQAGLSWATILKKREGYRTAFAGFDPQKVAAFTEEDIERLMNDPGIVRNRKKIESAVNNARRFLDVQATKGSFSNYIWSFVAGMPLVNHWRDIREVPAKTPLSETISKELKARGFTFLGPTVVYAHMQATGLVNDHLVHCFRHSQV